MNKKIVPTLAAVVAVAVLSVSVNCNSRVPSTGSPEATSVNSNVASGAALSVAGKVEDAAPPKGMVKLGGDDKTLSSLPKPMFIGTPKTIQSPNLEPPHPTWGRVSLLVPEGTANVALKKKVTASDKEPVIGSLDLITDADKEGADGSYVELGPGTQWVQIDLSQVYNIYAVAVWHYHSEARVYKDVVVQVADDADFITNVRAIYNNDHDNSSGLGIGKDYEYVDDYFGRMIDAKGVKARYVRLYSKGNTANEMNHYTEVEVFGKAP